MSFVNTLQRERHRAAQVLAPGCPPQAAQQLAQALRLVQPAGVVGVLSGGAVRAVSIGEVLPAPTVQAALALSFELASVTKPFTAALILRLCQQGRLDLDRPLARQLAAFAGYPHTVTPRTLLTHTAGLPVHPMRGALGQLSQFYDPYAALSPAGVLASGRRWAWLGRARAGAWRYSNLGYGLLALAAAQVAGEPYFAALGRHILLPLALNHTAHAPRTPLARPHGLLGSGRTSGFGGLTGAGGLYSTAHDLLHFAQAHWSQAHWSQAHWSQVNDGQAIHGWADMLRPAQLPAGWLGMAPGWFVSAARGGGMWWHDGVARGTRTLLAFVPDTRQAVCVLVASGAGPGRGSLLPVAQAVLEALSGEALSGEVLRVSREQT